jgi:hypothetical protein
LKASEPDVLNVSLVGRRDSAQVESFRSVEKIKAGEAVVVWFSVAVLGDDVGGRRLSCPPSFSANSLGLVLMIYFVNGRTFLSRYFAGFCFGFLEGLLDSFAWIIFIFVLNTFLLKSSLKFSLAVSSSGALHRLWLWTVLFEASVH